MTDEDPTRRVPGATGDDPSLIRRVRDGDAAAVAELYRRNFQMAVRLARQTGPHPDSAEDVASEAFTKTLEAIGRGAGPTENFSLYLRSAVRTVSTDALRRRARVRTVDNLEEVLRDTAPDPADLVDPADPALRRAFDGLSERHQHVLTLRAVQGRSSAESASVLGIGSDAEKMLYSRARRALRKKYQKAIQTRARKAGRLITSFASALVAIGGLSLAWFAVEQPTVHTVVQRSTPSGECAVVVHTPDLLDPHTTLELKKPAGVACEATYQRAGHQTLELSDTTPVEVTAGRYLVTTHTPAGKSTDYVSIP